MKIHNGMAAVVLALASAPALANDLNESIQDTLDNIDEQIEGARVWKFGVRPNFRQGLIWTDNVYLNDSGEQPYRLIGVTSNKGFITDPKKLQRIQQSVPDFRNLESEGRVSDWLSRTVLGASLVLPVNPDYTKLFDKDEMDVLFAEVRHHEYFDENDLDSTDFTFGSDVFGFLSDIFDFEQGNRFWVRGGGEYSRLKEPLDTDITQLQQIGIASVDFHEFERTEWEVRLDAGYRYNRFDASAGVEYYEFRLKDRELRQAEYDRTNFHAEAGYEIPQLQEKRGFVRFDYDQFEPNDRAVGGSQQALNDGDRYRIIAGIEGAFLSKKLVGRAGAGYESWDADEGSGLSGDRSDWHAPVAELELAYRPWEERNSQVQLSYERTAEASAISNYNAIHRGTVTLTHELVPEAWDVDASFGFTRTDASEGPDSKLYDIGLGVVYHWFDQVDVSLRYSYRYSDSWNEIRIQSSFSRGGRDYVYVSESNGDFYANTVELALDVRF